MCEAPRFGTAGLSDSYRVRSFDPQAMAEYTASFGLTAFEYQCGRGVRLGLDKAAALKEAFDAKGITFSVHAPYYISMSSLEEDKRLNSVNYLLQSCALVKALGGRRVIFHAGSCGKQSREAALEKALDTMRRAVQAVDEAGYGDCILCPETMGKVNQLGTLDEVEASLAKDIKRRGTHGALPGYSPAVTFGLPGGPVDTVDIHDTSALTEEELARFNAGSTSPVSAELARRAVALCNGNDVQARQVILSMGQSGAFLVRSNSHFTGIYQSEHSPLDIDVRREENGNVTMRFYKPAASPLDMDYTYTITPDGRGTLTACRIQARAPQAAAAGN